MLEWEGDGLGTFPASYLTPQVKRESKRNESREIKKSKSKITEESQL